MKTTSGKVAAQRVDFYGSMPGAFCDLEQRLQSVQAVARMIPVIGAENGSPHAMEVVIDLAVAPREGRAWIETC
ncbi:hypothetical protein [Accumulibacter sp.]|uniref:hypothetical protein n=1 Tax=Accumulibacter sp. TaxID=2053492 RepID=UPI0035B2F880